MDNSKVKRIWIVGDIHAGVRSNLIEWQDITEQYFNEYLIPLLKKNVKPGDILLQLGDVFENRQQLNLKVQHSTINIFERLGKIMPVHILVGNHDLYFKKNNDVTSLDCLKYIPNIQIYKEPEIVKFGQTDCLIMPWRADHHEEEKTLEQFPIAKYVFCHSELQGVQLNKKSVQLEGTRPAKFKNYFRVYTGHIHYSQTVGNIHLVGNAYQMTRSDHGNTKGTHLLDLSTDTHTFFENKVTPEFCKVNIANIKEMTLAELKVIVKNNFVDMYVDSDTMLKCNVSHLINLLQSDVRRIEPNIYDEKTYIDLDSITEEIQSGYKNFDVISLCSKWIEGSTYDLELKQKLKDKISQLYVMSKSNYNPDPE